MAAAAVIYIFRKKTQFVTYKKSLLANKPKVKVQKEILISGKCVTSVTICND